MYIVGLRLSQGGKRLAPEARDASVERHQKRVKDGTLDAQVPINVATAITASRAKRPLQECEGFAAQVNIMVSKYPGKNAPQYTEKTIVWARQRFDGFHGANSNQDKWPFLGNRVEMAWHWGCNAVGNGLPY